MTDLILLSSNRICCVEPHRLFSFVSEHLRTYLAIDQQLFHYHLITTNLSFLMHFSNHPNFCPPARTHFTPKLHEEKKPSRPGNAARQLVSWHLQQRCSVRAAITLAPINLEQTCCNEGVIGKCGDL